MSTVEALAAVSAFHSLAPATLQRLMAEATVIHRQPGAAFYQQGEAAPGMFTLLSGQVKLYRQSRERSQILAILNPGDCFGTESLAENSTSPCAASALTTVTAVYVAPDRLRSLLNECPDLQIAVLELVSGRLRQFVSLVHNLAFRDVTSRLAAVLLARAEVEGEQVADGVRIQRLLSQQELASLVGTAREVVYRTLKKLEQEHVLRLSSAHIVILDPLKLADIAREEAR